MILAQATQPVQHFPTWIIPLAGPVLSCAIADLQSYSAARKADPLTAKWDWVTFAIRMLIGLLTGAMMATGQSYAVS